MNKGLANLEDIMQMKEEDFNTAVTCGTIDRELLKVRPIF